MRYLQPLGRVPRVDRETFLVEAAKGKRVLHLGCVDAGLLQERLASRTLLHAKLSASADELWGLDQDVAGVRRLRELGFTHVYEGSAEAPPQEIPRHHFEVVIAGEIIEHVRNAGHFLDATARLVGPDGLVVITTPNALRFYNPVPAILGSELIHPEHLSWYSPYTLRNAVEASPFVVDRMYVYDQAPLAGLDGVANPVSWGARVACNAVLSVMHALLVRLFPYLSDGLILVGRPSKSH